MNKSIKAEDMIVRKSVSLIFATLILSSSLWADSIKVFAAADMKYALDSVKTEFLKSRTKDEIEIIYGSSGKGKHQIENGSPVDIYFSANTDFVQKLYNQGDVVTKPKLYAIGRVVIWSTHENFKPEDGFKNLTAPWVSKIAIANPSHAPYGEKAQQALESMKIYDDVKSKFVMGENISQTAGFISSGASEVGIIALSLALAPSIKDSKYNNYYLIDKDLHKPLEQGYGITKHGKESKLAKEFYDYIDSKEAKIILKKYGFTAE
jgi:molybdate transport system substrate-binding protein